MIKIQNKNSEFAAGQTLIEIVVSLGVILWISSMLVLYNRRGEATSALGREQQRLILDLRRVQDYALTTREFTPPGGVAEIPCGYGIHFDANSSQYIIFADRATGADCGSENFIRNPAGACPNGNEDVECVQLERSVKILSSNVTDIVFSPPAPKTHFSPGGQTEALITLALADNSSITARVRVNMSGEIAVAP